MEQLKRAYGEHDPNHMNVHVQGEGVYAPLPTVGELRRKLGAAAADVDPQLRRRLADDDDEATVMDSESTERLTSTWETPQFLPYLGIDQLPEYFRFCGVCLSVHGNFLGTRPSTAEPYSNCFEVRMPHPNPIRCPRRWHHRI